MTAPRFAPRSRGAGPRQVYVHAVSDGTASFVRFLDGLRQLHTHYAKVPGKKKGRSFPCAGDEECRSCKTGVAYVSKWYAPVLLYSAPEEAWVQWVLEVSENLFLVLRGRDLRGEEWRLYREGERGPRNPIFGTFLVQASEAELTEPCDVDAVLRAFYRVQTLPRPGESRIPMRPTSAPVKGRPPQNFATEQRKQVSAPSPLTPEVRGAYDALRSRLGTGSGAAPSGPRVPDRPAVPVPSTNGHAGKGGA